MTAAEKLRMEIAQEIPFSKDEFISKISRLIKAYGYASFICDKHIRETDVSPNDNTIRMAESIRRIIDRGLLFNPVRITNVFC